MIKQIPWLQRIKAVLASRQFWWLVLAFLVLQAAWIALSGRYPMAFDEDFHLGIIKLYAHHLSPFWSHQPESADPFGAVARDPSYLYQYLMSFPYKLLSLFTSNQSVIVICLRFINIGLFAGGLALFRRLLLKTKISPALVHLSLFVFVLLPIVPLLAAQINYDNLFVPLVALALLLAVRLDRILSAQKRLDAKLALQLLITCLLTCLVKYAFLPIFVAIAAFLAVRWFRCRRAVPLRTALTSWLRLGRGWQLALAVGLIVSAGLFYERIGLNVIRYHAPVPDCSKVLSVEQCREYGPWIRDYNFKLNKVSNERNPLVYTADWFYGMWLRTFYSLGGPAADYETRGPMPMPSIAAIFFTVTGLAALGLSARGLFRRYDAGVLWLCLAVAASYMGFLWLDEYLAWVRTAQPVAINGRYLLPVLPPAILLLMAALARLTRLRPRLQLAMMAVAVLFMLWGGGTLTFIMRSNEKWYWNSPVVRIANQAVKNVLGPVTPGYRNYVQFLK